MGKGIPAEGNGLVSGGEVRVNRFRRLWYLNFGGRFAVFYLFFEFGQLGVVGGELSGVLCSVQFLFYAEKSC